MAGTQLSAAQRLGKSISPIEAPKGMEKVGGEGLKGSWRKSGIGLLPGKVAGVGRNWRLMVLSEARGFFP